MAVRVRRTSRPGLPARIAGATRQGCPTGAGQASRGDQHRQHGGRSWQTRGGVPSTVVANVISLDRVSKGYGSAGPLLTDVSLGLGDSDRVGVVGLNGTGKSTLLRMLTKAEEPDSGRVTHRRDLRALSLPQTLDLTPTATVRDVVVGHAWLPAAFAAEHEWAGDAGIRTVLSGLGLPGLGLDTPVGADVRRRAAPGRAGGAAGPYDRRARAR